jgi:hypothetical protein
MLNLYRKPRLALLMGLAALAVAFSCTALATGLALTSALPLPGPEIRTELYQLPNANVCSYVFKFKVLPDRPVKLPNRYWTMQLGRATNDFHLWSEAQDYYMMVGAQANVRLPLVSLRCL